MREQIRKAAVISGIIADTAVNHSRISFVTEAEANLYFVLRHGPTTQLIDVNMIYFRGFITF
jgi:hypothetical protein